jgi:hypothetical protein
MKISIDTKHDSHHEIKKAIRLLQSLIEESSYANFTEQKTPPFTPPEGESVLGALFNSSSPEPSEPEPEPQQNIEMY